MPAHRKDFSRAVTLYVGGLSIEQVASQHGTSRQAMWKVLVRRGVQMRTVEPAPFIIWRDRKFTLRENGYYAETTGDREYLHREVWRVEKGPIPEGYEVHHRDEDKANNAPGNLQLLTGSEHGSLHGFGGNQYIPSIGRRPLKV